MLRGAKDVYLLQEGVTRGIDSVVWCVASMYSIAHLRRTRTVYGGECCRPLRFRFRSGALLLL